MRTRWWPSGASNIPKLLGGETNRRSMNPLQRGRLVLFDRGAAVGAVIAEQFVRQALLALLAGIRRPAAVETAWRDAQAGIGLLAGFAGAAGVHPLAGLLPGADLPR